MYEVVVPNEFKVGFVNRRDTFSGKLGYMIYANKEDGTFGQQKSYDGWRDKSIEERTLNNQFLPGFVLNKGRLNHYRFGASAKFRVFHPEGFEFEISLENLSLILGYATISSGEINLPCCIGWIGKNCYLIPKVDLSSEMKIIHQNIAEKQEKAEEKRKEKAEKFTGKPIPKRSLIGGRIVETESGERFYISKVTHSNRKDVMLQANLVKKYAPDTYLINKIEPRDDVTAMFSLSNMYGKRKNNDEFIKIVEYKDLAPEEEALFQKYCVEENIYFSEGFEFKAQSFEKVLLEETYNNLSKNDMGKYSNKRYIINHFLKKNNVVYAIGRKINYYSFYQSMTEKDTVVLGEKDLYGNMNGFWFLPIMSLDVKNKVFDFTQYMINTKNHKKEFVDLVNENFQELTSEDLDIIKQNALFVS